MMARAVSIKAPPEKLDPWNTSIWNPVDSVVVDSILLLPLPTRGRSGAAGFELDFPILELVHFLALDLTKDLTAWCSGRLVNSHF